MSEKFWKIPVEELKIVRVVCGQLFSVANQGEKKPCGTIVEVPAEMLGSVTICPVCQNPLHPKYAPGEDPFQLLGKVIGDLKKVSQTEVSFILSDNGKMD